MGTRWGKIIGSAVAGVILFFIIRNLRAGLGELGAYQFKVSHWRIVGSFGVLALLFPVYGRIWQYILLKFGYKIDFAKSMRIWFLSQAGRYIPGKVWFALGRIYLCERQGIPRSVASVATALELVLVLGSALVVFGLASAVSPSLPSGSYVFGLWLVPAIVIAVHPKIIRALLARLRKVPAAFSMRYMDVLRLLSLYVLTWCIYGIGFHLIGTSLKIEGALVDHHAAQVTEIIPQMVGINAISWAGGFLSVITPAGLGVREGISSVLLAGIVAKPYPSLIPLIARIWVTIAEVATIGGLLLLKGVR